MLRNVLVILVSIIGICFVLRISDFGFTVRPTLAAEFRTDHKIHYSVAESGQTHVTHQIALTNLTPNHYATDYTLNLNPKGLKNVQISGIGQTQAQLPFSLNPKGLKVAFGDALVGEGQKWQFKIEYDDSSIAQKVGRLWKVEIPAFNSSTSNTEVGEYQVSLNAPKSFGPLHYSSPAIVNQDHAIASESLTFTSTDDNPTPITAVFGDYQVYDFTLRYQINPIEIETPRQGTSMQAITLPPSLLPYQEVYVKSLNPLPEKIEKDGDENILAYYKASSDKPLTITYSGQIKIDNSDKARAKEQDVASSLTTYTLPDKYWETTHPQIQQLAADLQTPRAIYDYVTQNLTYNKERIKNEGGEIQRVGAVQALQDKENAICTEFTDLTIALLRAANVPAREVNGFAYVADSQKNDTRRPTISDVLHAWVMYYDKDANRWRQTDPTWGSTTRRDYFATLDTNHVILTIKGFSSEGPYPTNDVKITPAETIINDVQEFDAWLENFNYQQLPWYRKLILWIQKIFNNK